ncbi:hypothetical protein KJY73_06555 [Bowmanella sp. Y26]|uniref:hypothetical protein n=1 Tax=Bowmanella yangjiangensis TaxID=2811230 RepID=UPI001BDCE362|nr:hypothetical protein [Bowmanella yangjiangensis]MBT1063227.1 hypothetical protein [Bowmanella yangjiangensis]
MLVAAGCFVIEGVLINLLFPWVISPLIVAFLWLKYLRAHGFPGATAAANGFLFGASLCLLYVHIDWLLSGSVNPSISGTLAQVFVLAPLQAFVVGGLVSLLSYFASRIRRW